MYPAAVRFTRPSGRATRGQSAPKAGKSTAHKQGKR